MLFYSVPGMDKIFKKDIDKPKVILITGPPGSMKTTFCYTVMSQYLKKMDEFGVYTTLEESVDSHIQNIESLKIDLNKNMQISDFSDLREIDAILEEDEDVDYVALIEKMLSHFHRSKKEKFSMFALDSLGALYSLMENTKDMRKKMFNFFRMLRDYNLFSFVVMERSLGKDSNLLGNEGFLVDGIIMLGMDRSRGKLVRYMQVEKMRTSEHSMEKYAIDFKDGKLNILGPIFE